jgi:hypothetical protein
MGKAKSITQTIIVTLVCIVFIVVTAFYHHIDKHLTGVVFMVLTLLIPVTFIAMFVYAIKGLIDIARNRQNLTLILCMPTIVAVLALMYIFFSPWQFNSENLESKVEIRACYEGTQNQSYIKFREDKTFEINSTGVFFANDWYTGQWTKSSDTIFMTFDNGNPGFISDTLVIHNDYLIPTDKIELVDSIKDYRRFYYLGYCKGLN